MNCGSQKVQTCEEIFSNFSANYFIGFFLKLYFKHFLFFDPRTFDLIIVDFFFSYFVLSIKNIFIFLLSLG